MSNKIKDKIYFWIKYTDNQILEATKQYLYKKYGFDKNTTPQIKEEFLKNIYYSTHALEYLIDEGWKDFKVSIWNTSDFYNAIGYFDGRFLEEIKKRIVHYDSNEGDIIQEYIIDTQILLEINISEAIRLHRTEFDFIINNLESLIDENIKRRDIIYIEKWKEC